MSDLIWALKKIGIPGSMGFLALCIAVGLLIFVIGPRGRRIARVWLLFVFTTYFIAALPLVSHALTNRLPPFGPVWKPDRSAHSDILVVLSGDNPQGRARETRRVLDASNPRCVVVSGGAWFVRMIVAAGVERHRLLVDNTTPTTREQIAKLGAWAERCGAQRVVLIASGLSMPRIAALVRSGGLPVLLAPSSLDEPPHVSGIRAVVPSFRALRVSRDAFYEHAALAYYRRQGWIR